MTIYIDENYEVYTEETIDKEIAQRFSDCNYDGVVEYITDTYSEQKYLLCYPLIFKQKFLRMLKGGY